MTTTERARRADHPQPDPDSGTPDPITYGARVYDPENNRVGIIQVFVDPHLGEKCERAAWLRPEGGGREWCANADTLQPAPEQGAGR